MKEKELIVVIDGQGGKIGKELCDELCERLPQIEILAIGTNSIATANMLKSKVKQGATGENPVLVAARKATVIVGPIGIVIADALHGEITPAMAVAVGQSEAEKILIPVNRCSNQVVGTRDLSINGLIEEAVAKIVQLFQEG